MQHLKVKLLLVTCLGYHVLPLLSCVKAARTLHNAVHSWCLVSTVLDPPWSTGSQSHLTGREMQSKHSIAELGNPGHLTFIRISMIAMYISFLKDMRSLCSNMGAYSSITAAGGYTMRPSYSISTNMSNQVYFIYNYTAHRK